MFAHYGDRICFTAYYILHYCACYMKLFHKLNVNVRSRKNNRIIAGHQNKAGVDISWAYKNKAAVVI